MSIFCTGETKPRLDDGVQREDQLLISATSRRVDGRPSSTVPFADDVDSLCERISQRRVRRVHRGRVDRAETLPDGTPAGEHTERREYAQEHPHLAQEALRSSPRSREVRCSDARQCHSASRMSLLNLGLRSYNRRPVNYRVLKTV